MEATAEKKFRLPKEFAEKWIAALRSGKYKQTQSMLCRNAGDDTYSYCCLGIAGKICGYTDELMNGDSVLNGRRYTKVPQELQSIEFNPKLVCKVAGGMNDKGKSFEEIADWIEQNVELY